MSEFVHKELATGRWFKMSVLEQLGNVGSEVGRTRKWQEQDLEKFESARARALDLFDLTLADPRWGLARKTEIARARELFVAASYGQQEFGFGLADLEVYLSRFAYAARNILAT